MKIRILILSFILLCGGVGCEPFTTTKVFSTIAIFGGVITGINKYHTTKRGLDLEERGVNVEEREIVLKEKMFDRANEE